jgi:hypothetical protein
MITMQLITPQSSVQSEVSSKGESLTISAEQLHRATGYEVKPEGYCRGSVCIPAGSSIHANGDVDLTAFATLMKSHLVIDTSENVIALGESYLNRAAELTSLQAPDFTLPDLQGTLHKLSDYRGKKILLAAYASW